MLKIVEDTNCILNVRYSVRMKNSLPDNIEFEELNNHFNRGSFPNVHVLVHVQIKIKIFSLMCEKRLHYETKN